jgi:glycosyltransferase involved in cell wall biosynthesis
MIQVLVVHAHYLPGYKAGGPIRSLANMVDRLGDEFLFRVLTSDRDLLDSSPYPGIESDSWHAVGKAQVWYLSRRSASLGHLYRSLRAINADVLYLNSVFSPVFTIQLLMLRRVGLLGAVPFVLQPRGELCPGALAIKARKKRAYLSLARSSGLYDDILWHASTEYEASDIRREFGSHARVVIAPNLPGRTEPPSAARPRREKTAGALKIAFLSRISRKKNLHGALRLLHGLHGAVRFNIYGPIEDEEYWAECQRLIGQLPPNVQVCYHGAVPPDQVGPALSESHLFFLPTLGENYGHVILEALAAGCPVLLSDLTPWRDLEQRGVGWDLPLSQPDRFKSVLQQCVDMTADAYSACEQRVREYAGERAEGQGVLDRYRALFQGAVDRDIRWFGKSEAWTEREAA